MACRSTTLDAACTAPPVRCAWLVGGLILALALSGCGTTQQNHATQQLLESDAIDAAVAQIDFTPLAGHKVYFDESYIRDYKGVGFVNSNYVISGLRQQILAAGCELQEAKTEAEYVIEGRLGTLGADSHELVYGIPKNNAINGFASAVPGSPVLPAIPELALAKKASSKGAAKLALFAYHRETRQPVWQSGLSVAHSSARDTWIMGAGPFQDGTIHRDRVTFAGGRFGLRFWNRQEQSQRDDGFAAFENSAVFGPQAEDAAPEAIASSPPTQAPSPLAPVAAATATPIPQPEAAGIVQVSAETVSQADAPPIPAGESATAAAIDINAPADPRPFPGE